MTCETAAEQEIVLSVGDYNLSRLWKYHSQARGIGTNREWRKRINSTECLGNYPRTRTSNRIVMAKLFGGYLEHRRKSPIGIPVLWRGWSNLHDLCQGWLLAQILKSSLEYQGV